MNITSRRTIATLALTAVAGLGVNTTSAAEAAAPELSRSSAVRTNIHSVTFSTRVTDPAGDVYCTQLTARIYDGNGQIGNEVNYGTVCGGGWHDFSNQVISTVQNRTITMVMLTARRGFGGEAVYVWGRNF